MKISNTSNRLKLIMHERNLKQVDILELCKPFCEKEKVKMQKSDLSQYISGKVEPKQDKLSILASALNVSEAWLAGYDIPKSNKDIESRPKDKGWIPVLGYVAAGIPIEAIENVLDWEQIDPHLLDSAEYFALEIKGDSMSPRIQEGDIVIVRVQPDIESGEIGIVQVNGDEATCKIVCKYRDQLTLKSINPAYGPLRYSINEMSDIPINILGKVVELRRKF